MHAAFVNANLPKGTCIQEQLYPLYGDLAGRDCCAVLCCSPACVVMLMIAGMQDIDGSEADVILIAKRLLDMAPKKADQQVSWPKLHALLTKTSGCKNAASVTAR